MVSGSSKLTWGRLCPMFLWCGMAVLHLKMFIILILWDMPTYCIGYSWFPFCPWCYQNSYPQSNKLWGLLVCSTYIESSKIWPHCRTFITLFQYYYCYSLVSYPFPSSADCVVLKEETNECIWLLFPQSWKGEGGEDYLEWGVVLSLIF